MIWFGRKEGSEKEVRANQVKGLSFKSSEVVPPSPVQDDVPPRSPDWKYPPSHLPPVEDSVPPVRSEPSNSNDQREFHYEFNGESQGPISFLDLQRLVRQEVVTNTSVKLVTLSRQSSRRRHHRELRSHVSYTPHQQYDLLPKACALSSQGLVVTVS